MIKQQKLNNNICLLNIIYRFNCIEFDNGNDDSDIKYLASYDQQCGTSDFDLSHLTYMISI